MLVPSAVKLGPGNRCTPANLVVAPAAAQLLEQLQELCCTPCLPRVLPTPLADWHALEKPHSTTHLQCGQQLLPLLRVLPLVQGVKQAAQQELSQTSAQSPGEGPPCEHGVAR